MTKSESASPPETTQNTCEYSALRMISKDRLMVEEVGAVPRTPIWDDTFTNGGWSMMPEIVSVLHDGSIEAKWASVDWCRCLALSFSFKELQSFSTMYIISMKMLCK